MKLVIERSALLKSLGHVQSVVERRTTIPILSNVRLDADKGSLRLISQEGAGAVFRIDLPIDFEVMSEEETIRWQRSSGDGSSHPIAEEFLE